MHALSEPTPFCRTRAIAWTLVTALYAALAPFIAIGCALFIMWMLGASAEDAHDLFALLGTGTVADFQYWAAVLQPLALLTSIVVVLIRVLCNGPLMDAVHRAGARILMRLPGWLREPKRGGVALLTALMMVGVLALLVLSPQKPMEAPRLLNSQPAEARATIVLPDGGAIVSGHAHIERVPDGRYVVSFQD